MIPFSIAGIQMHVSASHSNVPLMKHKIDVMMSVYPWVQMIVFSELSPFGPLTFHAQEFPNTTENDFCAIASIMAYGLFRDPCFRKKGISFTIRQR